MQLVGRDAALGIVGAAMADALSGTGQLLLVAGEPGIGKSALVAEQARRASAAGITVLRGSCWEGAGAPPYWLWTQVLRGLGSAGIPTSDAGTAAEAADARFRLFEAVGATLAAAAPLVVVLEDLQWADEPSLELLDFLRRRLLADRVLLLGGYRDAEAGPTLTAIAGSAAGVPLTGLDAADTAALIATVAGRAPSRDEVDAVLVRSGGNPFLVRELTRLMLARGTGAPLPDGVRETLRHRLARLSAGCAGLLDVAAVAGSKVEPDLLAEIGPDEQAAIVDLLAEAERARVLERSGTGLRFVHDLYRETVLAALPAARRAELHAAVGSALVALSGGGVDLAAVGGAARLAAHFVAAGPQAVDEALHHSVLAAREATARMGHDDAARHYTAALGLLRDKPEDSGRRIELLLELAAATDRTGAADDARAVFVRVAALARAAGDAAALAAAALGLAGMGARWGSDDRVAAGLLTEAADLLAGGEEAALRSRVLASLARGLRHASVTGVDPKASAPADEAVELARTAGDPAALALALLARHDVMWVPGTAGARLPLLRDMAAAAERAGDRDLAAEALALRAAALIELGDPEGPAELARYTRVAARLGHARGRWGALTRRATHAELTGRIEEAVAASAEALELGTAIGVPDAMGCFATLRGSLATIGGPPLEVTGVMPADDPLFPMYPMLQAWSLVHAGDTAAAAAVMKGFSVHAIPKKYDLEMVAVCSAVFAAVGTREQREWAYHSFTRSAGTHAIVGGCAAYHGAVDHHLGSLAAALGNPARATAHFTAAIEQYGRLGAAAWADVSRAELARLQPSERNAFRFVDGVWQLSYAGQEVHAPDAKGLHDIATLLGTPGAAVHVFTLLGRPEPSTEAEPVLDQRARTHYRARLGELESEIDEATRWRDGARVEKVTAERDALVAELTAAVGLGGRPRRLGDEVERARKTVGARIRDALRRVEAVHAPLAQHLRASVRTGTTCSYVPPQPQRWRL